LITLLKRWAVFPDDHQLIITLLGQLVVKRKLGKKLTSQWFSTS